MCIRDSFKWGREGSLAWVTALDTGLPVAGAEIRVSDSCTGRLLARGTADKAGRLAFAGGLPQPETYSDCEETPDPTKSEGHALMVSARSGDDFSFTLTDWGSGIRPYDFDLPYGWSEREDILHTVFDRSLVKAGGHVHMNHFLPRPVGPGFSAPPSMLLSPSKATTTSTPLAVISSKRVPICGPASAKIAKLRPWRRSRNFNALRHEETPGTMAVINRSLLKRRIARFFRASPVRYSITSSGPASIAQSTSGRWIRNWGR